MITPNQIREKKISTAQSGGYDRDEVNELLLEIIESYEAIFNENKELYRKMEILANRIEEYRADEDSIKTALITAQKMADQVKREAKEKAEQSLSASAASAHQTVVDAQEKADKIVGEAREYVAGLTKEKAQAADEIISEAQKKANDVIEGAKVVAGNALLQAKKLATEIVNTAKAERDYHSEIVSNLKGEAKAFREMLVSLYETQLDNLNEVGDASDSAENDNVSIDELEKEFNTLMATITEAIGDDEEAEEEIVQEVNEPEEPEIVDDSDETDEKDEKDEIDEIDEIEEIEDSQEEVTEFTEEAQEEKIEIESEIEDVIDEVDEIIDELESAGVYAPLHEEEPQPPTEEEVSSAIDAFSTDEITPIDDSTPTIPIIEDDDDESMPFESFFNVKKGNERTTETISLISPDEEDDDEDDEDGSRFKGFFKKKK